MFFLGKPRLASCTLDRRQVSFGHLERCFQFQTGPIPWLEISKILTSLLTWTIPSAGHAFPSLLVFATRLSGMCQKTPILIRRDLVSLALCGTSHNHPRISRVNAACSWQLISRTTTLAQQIFLHRPLYMFSLIDSPVSFAFSTSSQKTSSILLPPPNSRCLPRQYSSINRLYRPI